MQVCDHNENIYGDTDIRFYILHLAPCISGYIKQVLRHTQCCLFSLFFFIRSGRCFWTWHTISSSCGYPDPGIPIGRQQDGAIAQCGCFSLFIGVYILLFRVLFYLRHCFKAIPVCAGDPFVQYSFCIAYFLLDTV